MDFIELAGIMGPNCTPRAVQERLKKLKKIAAERIGETNKSASTVPRHSKKSKKQDVAHVDADKEEKPAIVKKGKKSTSATSPRARIGNTANGMGKANAKVRKEEQASQSSQEGGGVKRKHAEMEDSAESEAIDEPEVDIDEEMKSSTSSLEA